MNKVIECIAKKKSINANNDINTNLMFDLINRVTWKKSLCGKKLFLKIFPMQQREDFNRTANETKEN